MIKHLTDLMKWAMVAHGGSDPLNDTVNHHDPIFIRLNEYCRRSAGNSLSEMSRKNQNSLNYLRISRASSYVDPIEKDVQCFAKTLTLELELDAEYVHAYNHQFLSRCGLAAEMRSCLIQWMLLVHWWKGIPTQILHEAVGLMDLYTWLSPITLQDYQLLAVAAITTAIRNKSLNVKINYLDLCMTTNYAYTQGQVTQMEAMLRECIRSRSNFPTPHRFLDFYLFGLTEFTGSMLEWTREACKYIFDLGLCEDYLCRSSASLRCAAVLYLIRRILRHKCDCGLLCRHRCMPAWSSTMVKFTGHRETTHLRQSAKIYGQLLLSIAEETVPCSLDHRSGRINSVVFNKYVRKEYNEIAMDSKLRFLTQEFLNNFATA